MHHEGNKGSLRVQRYFQLSLISALPGQNMGYYCVDQITKFLELTVENIRLSSQEKDHCCYGYI